MNFNLGFETALNLNDVVCGWMKCVDKVFSTKIKVAQSMSSMWIINILGKHLAEKR